jgi:sugar-specific transcriptional regulator TrmB
LTWNDVVVTNTTMSLEPFGFTRTQDIVFWALARHGIATGYAIARDTGMARANVYHALEVLARRGLASSTGGRPSRYQANSADACLNLLKGGVERELTAIALKLGLASASTASVPSTGVELGEIRNQAELVAQVTECVAAATSEVLVVTGPWMPELASLLAAARRRRVSVRAVSLGSPAPEGAVVRDVPRAELLAYWGGLPVALVGDRRRAVCAVATSDGVHGTATANPGMVPFLRHLLRRELATAAAPRVS